MPEPKIGKMINGTRIFGRRPCLKRSNHVFYRTVGILTPSVYGLHGGAGEAAFYFSRVGVVTCEAWLGVSPCLAAGCAAPIDIASSMKAMKHIDSMCISQ